MAARKKIPLENKLQGKEVARLIAVEQALKIIDASCYAQADFTSFTYKEYRYMNKYIERAMLDVGAKIRDLIVTEICSDAEVMMV